MNLVAPLFLLVTRARPSLGTSVFRHSARPNSSSQRWHFHFPEMGKIIHNYDVVNMGKKRCGSHSVDKRRMLTSQPPFRVACSPQTIRGGSVGLQYIPSCSFKNILLRSVSRCSSSVRTTFKSCRPAGYCHPFRPTWEEHILRARL